VPTGSSRRPASSPPSSRRAPLPRASCASCPRSRSPGSSPP
jgi:hypothetical protein